MNDQERFAIEHACARLIHEYSNLSDAGRWSDVADLFAPDGLLAPAVGAPSPIVGREALLQSFLARPPVIARHFCANITVSVESKKRATAFSLLTRVAGNVNEAGGLPLRDPSQPIIAEFRDAFVRVDGVWRFAERRGALVFSPH